MYKINAKSSTASGNYIEVSRLGDSSSTGLEFALDGDHTPIDVFYVKPITDATVSGGWFRQARNTVVGNLIIEPAGKVFLGIGTFIVGAKYRFGDAGTSVITERLSGTRPVQSICNYMLQTPLTRRFNINRPGGDNTVTRVFSTIDSDIRLERGTGLCAGPSDIDTCPVNDPAIAGDRTNNIIQFAGHTTTYEIIDSRSIKLLTTDRLFLDKNLTAPVANGEAIYRSLMRGTTATDEAWTSTLTPKSGTGSGKNIATFELDVTNDNLNNGTRILMIYQINNATALADPGQDIKMQVSLVTPINKILVNPAREIVIAKSKQASEVSLKAVETGQVRVSVDSGSTAFTGTTPGPYISATTAQIGYLDIRNGHEITSRYL